MARVFRHFAPRLLGVLLLSGMPALAYAPLAVAPVNSSEDAEGPTAEAPRESRPEALRAPRLFDPGTPATMLPPPSAARSHTHPAVRPDLFGTGLRSRLRC